MPDTIHLTSEEALLHAVMYAKGHYKEDKNLEGLRVIAGHYAAIGVEYVNDNILLQFALTILEKFKPTAKVSHIIQDAFQENWKWHKGKDQDTISRIDVIQCILSEVRYLTIHELPPLPVANPEIYPLREK